MKKCNQCGADKELDAFVKDPRNTNGRKSYCKECANKKSKAAGAKRRAEQNMWSPI